MAGPESDELALLRTIAARSSESVAVYELDGRVVFVNAATERFFGLTADAMVGRRLFDDLFPSAKGNPFHRAFERVAAGGEAEDFEHYYAPFDRWFANHVERVGDQIHVHARDVTDDLRRRRRLEVLAQIAEVLARPETNDPRGATQAIAEILTNALDADCTISRVVDAATLALENVAWASRDETTRALLGRLPRWTASTHTAEALRTRQPLLVTLDAGHAEAIVETEELRREVATYGVGTVIVVPLLLGNEVSGVLVATRRRSAPPLTENERVLGADIAPSLALSLAHARRRDESLALEEQLTAFADSLPALLAFVGRDERYRYVNQAYEVWFGKPRASFVHQRIQDVVPSGETYTLVKRELEKALAGAPTRYRMRVDYPGKGRRDVDVQYLPVRGRSGEIEEVAVLVQDVTHEARLADLEHVQLRRLERILSLTAKLAAAEREDEIARVLVDEGVDALETTMCGLYLVSPDAKELVLVRQRGFRPEHAAAMARIPLDSSVPIATCAREKRSLWAESREDYAAQFPEAERALRPENAPPIAFALTPIVIEGRVEGVFGIALNRERTLVVEERAYVEILASHGAEALRRARLYDDLRDMSLRHEAMIAASPAAIMLLDDQTVVRSWNPAAERMFGWSREEAVGNELRVFGHLEAELRKNLASVLAGNVVHGREAVRLRKSGEWFPLELFAAPITTTRGQRMVLAMAVDVTERKRTERARELVAEASAALARSLEWKEILAQVVRLPMTGIADGCSIHLLQDGHLHPVAVEGRSSFGLPFVHDPAYGGGSLAIAERRAVLERDLDDAAYGRLARTQEHLAWLRERQMRSYVAAPIVSGERVFGVLSISSSTRNLDDVDVGLATELAERVAFALENARLYEEVKTAKNEAEAANRAKDEFLAVLGHELRNPLAPISTAVHLLKMKAPESVVKERNVIERQVTHLSRLVDDLLDVSRIARGKVELRREPTTVEEAVHAALEATSQLLESRRHVLTVDVEPGLELEADPARLRQVVTNILANAAKYTPPAGHIQVRARRRRGRAELVVEDDGVGIPPDLLPRIFDSFVQAPQPIARSAGGLGLGLTIVKSLVELHGGTVHVASEGVGHGTRVTVELPALPKRKRSDSSASESSEVLAMTAPHPRRVLVVDDNEDAAVLLRDLLDARGHDARTAFDGPSALRLAAEFRPDVAILDIGLPVMDGYELAARLRELSPESSLRLIALTGYSAVADKQRATGAGFHAHVAKPVAIEELVELFERP